MSSSLHLINDVVFTIEKYLRSLSELKLIDFYTIELLKVDNHVRDEIDFLRMLSQNINEHIHSCNALMKKIDKVIIQHEGSKYDKNKVNFSNSKDSNLQCIKAKNAKLKILNKLSKSSSSDKCFNNKNIEKYDSKSKITLVVESADIKSGKVDCFQQNKDDMVVFTTSGCLEEEQSIIIHPLDNSSDLENEVEHQLIQIDKKTLEATKLDNKRPSEVKKHTWNLECGERLETQAFSSDVTLNCNKHDDLPVFTLTDTLNLSKTYIANSVKMGPEDLRKYFGCSVCKNEFPTAGSLKSHYSNNHSNVILCYTCLKVLDNKGDLVVHIKNYHGDIPYICIECGKSYKTSMTLQRHILTHRGIRSSACDICGQTFSRRAYYTEHKRIHTGERPFQCDICYKRFITLSNMYTHRKTHKPKEDQLNCTTCNKTFARLDQLKYHTLRHLGIKRYACKLCSKRYSERRDLKKHINRVHVEK